MPVGMALKLGRQCQGQVFTKCRCNKLHAHGQALGKPAGNRHGGQASQTRGHGVQILLVHGHRVVCELVFVERWGWRGGRQQQVYVGEGIVEILSDKPPYFLRFEVVGIEIADRQSRGASPNAPFHFLPKTFFPRALVQVLE